MDDPIDRIRRKIFILQDAGWNQYKDLDLGINHHRFLLNPIKPLFELQQFEESVGVVLPDGYRRFISEIGNGGMGPYYGLLALEVGIRQSTYPNEDVAEVLKESCKIQDASLSQDTSFNSCLDNPVDEPCHYKFHPLEGTIAVCDQGCTYCSVIVVTGSKAGRIFNAEEENGSGFLAPFPSFLDWYEGWLDNLIAKKQMSWYGF